MGLIAFLFRFAPYFAPASLFAARGYDDAVFYGGALALLGGNLPYADFVYVQPPGSLLTIAPFAALASPLSDAGGLAVARVGWILIGTANTVLIGWLLRNRGVWAVVVGAGLYAVWPAVVASENTVMLEPILNLCLLIALACIQTRRRALLWVAGASMGLALTVKYWSAIDIAILVFMVAAIAGVAGMIRFVAAGVVTAAAVAVPFFVAAPLAMWDQTVITQMLRNDRRPPFGERVNLMSPLANFRELDQRIPWWAWAALVIGLVIVSAVPLVASIVRRRPPREWPDGAWWGALVVAHSITLTLSGTFFDHYAAWLIAPMALCTGAALDVVRPVWIRRAAGALVLVSVVALAAGAAQGVRAPHSQDDVIRTWAATRQCVWGPPALLVVADAVTPNIARDCPGDIDPIGVRLLLREPEQQPAPDSVAAARAWQQIMASDGAILPVDQDGWWLTTEKRMQFLRDFTMVAQVDGNGLWNRQDAARTH